MFRSTWTISELTLSLAKVTLLWS